MADICKKGKNLYFHSDSSSKRNRGNSQEGVAKNDWGLLIKCSKTSNTKLVFLSIKKTW